MNFYKLEMNYLVDDYYSEWDLDYVIHEKKFSQEEFKKICHECLDKCNYKNMPDLKIELGKLGFKEIEPVATFEFEYGEETEEIDDDDNGGYW